MDKPIVRSYIILYNILKEDSIERTISRAYTYIERGQYIENSTITGLLIESILKINKSNVQESLNYLQLLQDNLEEELIKLHKQLSEKEKEYSKVLDIKSLCYQNQFLYVNQKKKLDKYNTLNAEKLNKCNWI